MKFMSYVTEVANLFLSRCRRVKILSPMDYAIIAEWEKEEIPLAVVFESLNTVFDNLQQNIELVNIESIRHFQNEVKKNFANWLHSSKNV
jgi:hypothetical protein